MEGVCLMFSVGDKIMHPMHGAGVIQKIEERKILGEVKAYYVLKLPCNDMDVMLPTDAESSVGIRRIVDKTKIEQAFQVLKAGSSSMDSNWNRRFRENMELLRSGDILKVAEVVRNLTRIDRRKKLSAGEKKMLLNARQVLISEIILVCDLPEKTAVKLVEDSI
jgi:CarD family transcriptional regulator